MANRENKGNIEWYLKRFADYENTLNGKIGGALHRLRKSALKKFADSGFPTMRDEEWKYTNLKELSLINFDPSIRPDFTASPMPKLFNEWDTINLLFVNGRIDKNRSNLEQPGGAIDIRLLSSMAEEDVVRLISAEEDIFSSFNTAFFSDGIYIHIPENYTESKPLHIINISQSNGKRPLCQPRTVVKVGRNAKIQIIETFIGSDGQEYFTNPVSTITLDENAYADHYRIQMDGSNAHHISATSIHLARSANFISHAISFGSKLNRNDIMVEMTDENANCTLNGLYVGNKEQHIDNRTVIEHKKAHCLSTQVYKGILDNRAQGVFNGKIHVYPDAQKTNAEQSNNCMLLSDDATINAKPQLEIYADDVRCTHGATVGQLDSDAIFYLRSRGIDEVKAKSMLIHAFASDVLTKMSLEQLKNWVVDHFVDKLHSIKVD